MRKYFVLLLSIFLLLLVIGCNRKIENLNILVLKKGLFYREGHSDPFTGSDTVRKLDRIMISSFKNGMKTGEFKILYRNKQPQIIGQLVNNQNEGLWKYFYPNSKVESQGYFVDNIPEGNWKWFYENGKISEEGNFVHGLRSGNWLNYDSLGKIIGNKNFVNGIEKGKKEIKKGQILK